VSMNMVLQQTFGPHMKEVIG